MVSFLHVNLISCRVGFLLSCFYESNCLLDVLCCYFSCFKYLFSKLWLCWVLIAAGAFFTDVDRFPWKSQSEFCVVRAKHKFKSLGFVCSPSFFSPHRVSPFLAWGDFHGRLHFARSTIPEEKWGTTPGLVCLAPAPFHWVPSPGVYVCWSCRLQLSREWNDLEHSVLL